MNAIFQNKSARRAAIIAVVITVPVVFLFGFLVSPSQYVARGVYIVNWKLMPNVPGDGPAEKVREAARELLRISIVRPRTDVELRNLAMAAVQLLPPPARSNPARNLLKDAESIRSGLHVVLTTDRADLDCFDVFMTDANSTWAVSVAAAALQDGCNQVEKLRSLGNGVAILRTAQKYSAQEDKHEELATERRKADPKETKEIDRQMAEARGDQIELGLGVLANSFGGNPLKITEPVRLVPVAGKFHYMRIIWFSILCGLVAGMVTITVVSRRAPPRLETGSSEKMPPLLNS